MVHGDVSYIAIVATASESINSAAWIVPEEALKQAIQNTLKAHPEPILRIELLRTVFCVGGNDTALWWGSFAYFTNMYTVDLTKEQRLMVDLLSGVRLSDRDACDLHFWLDEQGDVAWREAWVNFMLARYDEWITADKKEAGM